MLEFFFSFFSAQRNLEHPILVLLQDHEDVRKTEAEQISWSQYGSIKMDAYSAYGHSLKSQLG